MDLVQIRERREQLALEYSLDSAAEIAIREVIHRFRGEAGLSQFAENYLTNHIMYTIKELVNTDESCH